MESLPGAWPQTPPVDAATPPSSSFDFAPPTPASLVSSALTGLVVAGPLGAAVGVALAGATSLEGDALRQHDSEPSVVREAGGPPPLALLQTGAGAAHTLEEPTSTVTPVDAAGLPFSTAALPVIAGETLVAGQDNFAAPELPSPSNDTHVLPLNETVSTGSKSPPTILIPPPVNRSQLESPYAKHEQQVDAEIAAAGGLEYGRSAAEAGLGPHADLSKPVQVEPIVGSSTMQEVTPVDEEKNKHRDLAAAALVGGAGVGAVAYGVTRDKTETLPVDESKTIPQRISTRSTPVVDATPPPVANLHAGSAFLAPVTAPVEQTEQKPKSDTAKHVAETAAVGTGAAVVAHELTHEATPAQSTLTTHVAVSGSDTSEPPHSQFTEAIPGAHTFPRDAPARFHAPEVVAGAVAAGGIGAAVHAHEAHAPHEIPGASSHDAPAHGSFEDQRATPPAADLDTVTGAGTDATKESHANPTAVAGAAALAAGLVGGGIIAHKSEGLDPATFKQDLAHLSEPAKSTSSGDVAPSEIKASVIPPVDEARGVGAAGVAQTRAAPGATEEGDSEWQRDTLAAMGAAGAAGALSHSDEPSRRYQRDPAPVEGGPARDGNNDRNSEALSAGAGGQVGRQDDDARHDSDATRHPKKLVKPHPLPTSELARHSSQVSEETFPRAASPDLQSRQPLLASEAEGEEGRQHSNPIEFSPHMHISTRRDSVGHKRLVKASHESSTPPRRTPSEGNQSGAGRSRSSSVGEQIWSGSVANVINDETAARGNRPTLVTIDSEDGRNPSMAAQTQSPQGRVRSVSSGAPPSPSSNPNSATKQSRRTSNGSELSATPSAETPGQKKKGLFSRVFKRSSGASEKRLSDASMEQVGGEKA